MASLRPALRRWCIGSCTGSGLYAAAQAAPGTSDEIRELRSLWWKVNGQHTHARVGLDLDRSATLPLVLVHGLGVSGSYFIPAAQQLAAEFDVYVPDLPRHGLSDTPSVQLDIPGLAEALVDWMDAPGLARVALVDHSMGCQVAIEAALRHSQRIDRLVLIAPVPDPAARSAFQQVCRLAIGSVFERPLLILHVFKDYLRIGRLFFPEFRHMLAYLIEAKMPEIGVPFMLVRGEHDAIAPQA